MNELPTIRIELNGVKESVIHGFRAKQEEIKEYVSKVIEASFNTLVQSGLEEAIISTTKETLEEVIVE